VSGVAFFSRSSIDPFAVRERGRGDVSVLAECVPEYALLAAQSDAGRDGLAQVQIVREVSRAALLIALAQFVLSQGRESGVNGSCAGASMSTESKYAGLFLCVLSIVECTQHRDTIVIR
jgi:hypothetical protein